MSAHLIVAGRENSAHHNSQGLFPTAPAYAMQVLSVFQERRIISDETARFEELLVRQRDFFVEEELKEKYKRLISFVQQTEKNMSSAETGERSRV